MWYSWSIHSYLFHSFFYYYWDKRAGTVGILLTLYLLWYAIAFFLELRFPKCGALTFLLVPFQQTESYYMRVFFCLENRHTDYTDYNQSISYRYFQLVMCLKHTCPQIHIFHFIFCFVFSVAFNDLFFQFFVCLANKARKKNQATLMDNVAWFISNHLTWHFVMYPCSTFS